MVKSQDCWEFGWGAALLGGDRPPSPVALGASQGAPHDDEDTAEDDSQDADADGTQVIVEGEEPEGDIIIDGAPGQDGTEMAADNDATADDAAEATVTAEGEATKGETVEGTETGVAEIDTGDRLAAVIASAEEAVADVRDAAARLSTVLMRSVCRSRGAPPGSEPSDTELFHGSRKGRPAGADLR